MPQRLRQTWIALVIACLAVVASGALVVGRFYGHVFVKCRGTLMRVPDRELKFVDGEIERTQSSETMLDIAYDQKPGPHEIGTTYSNPRVVWKRADASCACSDLPLFGAA